VRVAYIYPKGRPDSSFHMAAEEYIRMLPVYVDRVDNKEINNVDINSYDLIFIHPFFYSVMQNNYNKVIKTVMNRAVAVDVADSNAICRECANLVNQTLGFVVPSYWSLSIYYKSGVKVPGYVWPHPLDDFWFSDEEPECELDLPEGGVKILFFVLHSFRRKGGDILARALEELQRRGVKFSFVVRTSDEGGDNAVFKKFGAVYVKEFLSRECLKKLYMWADAVPVPSRGGGFERNFYEALASGTPAFAPKYGPWIEHLHPVLFGMLTLEVVRWEPPLPGNYIHVGLGPVASHVDLADKLERAVELKEEVKKYRSWLKERLSFRSVEVFVRRDFLQILNRISL